MATIATRRGLLGLALVLGGLAAAWVYYRNLIPAVHQDHDHGLENLAGGGFLRIERRDGSERNLVGKPEKVLVLHWFRLDRSEALADWPALRDYIEATKNDPGIEVVLIATGTSWPALEAWAAANGAPADRLYIDAEGATGKLIGVRRFPETFIYDPEGHLAHQARGPLDWSSPDVRASIEEFKHGAGEHQH